MRGEPLPLYDVPRLCPCGTAWVGKSFTPLAVGEPTPRRGVCRQCVDREYATAQKLVHPIREAYIPDVELAPPRRVRNADDDDGPQVIELPMIREPGE